MLDTKDTKRGINQYVVHFVVLRVLRDLVFDLGEFSVKVNSPQLPQIQLYRVLQSQIKRIANQRMAD